MFGSLDFLLFAQWQILKTVSDVAQDSCNTSFRACLAEQERFLMIFHLSALLVHLDFIPTLLVLILGIHSLASSIIRSDLCAPCDLGTYSNISGAGSCAPCPANSFCPVGSSVPFSRTYWKQEQKTDAAASYDSLQPIALEKKDQRNNILTIATFSAAGGFTLLTIIIFLTGWKWFNAYYSRLDMFKTRHYTPGRYGYVSFVVPSLNFLAGTDKENQVWRSAYDNILFVRLGIYTYCYNSFC